MKKEAGTLAKHRLGKSEAAQTWGYLGRVDQNDHKHPHYHAM